MKTRTRFLARAFAWAILVAAVSFTAIYWLALIVARTDAAAATWGCSTHPIKPAIPVGCRDIVAECRCDATGTRCQWVWRCIR